MLGNHRETILNYLKKQYPACKITVDSDIRSIVGLARENDKCIAAIIGTGSVVYGWNGTTFKRVGGWGYLFDDAGSGYDIGREVLLAAYAYADGLAPLSEVVRLTEIKLGGPVTDHTSKLYSEGRAYIASFCPIAFEALAMGDALAEKIISKSAARFAGLINHMYSLGEYGNRVVISGGLAMHSMTMSKIIAERLDPGVTVEFPDMPPVFGAMRVCAEYEYGGICFEQFEENFNKSYKDKK
jgi:N-acetylglucosamine kinase-like BadF-type ATPase